MNTVATGLWPIDLRAGLSDQGTTAHRAVATAALQFYLQRSSDSILSQSSSNQRPSPIGNRINNNAAPDVVGCV